MKQKLREFWALAKAEGKKTVVLGVLLGVCAVLGARALLSGKPKRTPAATVAPVAGAPNVAAPAAPGPAPVTPLAAASEAGANALDLTPPRRYAQRPVPSRDLFALNPALFPDPAPSDGAGGADGAKSASGIDDKSGTDAPPEAGALRRRALEDASRLRVRSIMLGAQPAAVLESAIGDARRAEVVRVGDRVAGFVVAEITSIGVRVERDGAEALLEPPARRSDK